MEWISHTWHNFINFFHYSMILSLGMLLFCGYYFGKLFERLKMPAITGYIVSGLLLGESILGIVHTDTSVGLHYVTDVALGFIALTIGGEFSLAKIKRMGVPIFILTLFEAVFAFIFVTTFLTISGFLNLSSALILGAISAATAPAATVIIIRELRARGEFIDYLYGIVALDDAACVILFGIIFAAVSPMLSGAVVHGAILLGLFHALSELFFSFLLGVFGGFLVHFLTIRKIKSNEVLLVALSLLFIVTALADALRLSPLLADMAMGATIINLAAKNRRIFSLYEPLTPPIFALFFIIAGTELDIHVFAQGTIVFVGLLYLVSRFVGKLVGIFLGGTLTKTPQRTRNYLGFCLFPQAGVAIGLALFVQTSNVALHASPEVRESLIIIVNVVLFSVFINELIGPAISRFGIKKGCDIEG